MREEINRCLSKKPLTATAQRSSFEEQGLPKLLKRREQLRASRSVVIIMSGGLGYVG